MKTQGILDWEMECKRWRGKKEFCDSKSGLAVIFILGYTMELPMSLL